MLNCVALLLILFSSACGATSSQSAWEDFYKTRIVKRSEWGAKAPNAAKLKRDRCKNRMAIHHSAGNASSSGAVVLSIQSYHMNTRGYGDVAYHFFVGSDGQIFEGRELDYVGAHVEGHNQACVGICCLGCFDTSACSRETACEVHEALVASLADLMAHLAIRFQIPIEETGRIKAHCDFEGARTLCPGDKLIHALPSILERARQRQQELLQQAIVRT